MKYKRVLLAIVSSILILTSFNAAFAMDFLDVSESSELYNILLDITQYGISNGYGDGTFKPNNNVTKSELAVFIANMTPYDHFDNSVFPQYFEDVKPDHWAYKYIGKATGCGVFSTFEKTPFEDKYVGTTAATFVNIENSIFHPDSYATYAEAIKAIISLQGYNGIAEKNGGYKNGYIDTARHFCFLD